MSRYFEVLFHLLGAGVEEALSFGTRASFSHLTPMKIGVKYEQGRKE